MTSLGAALIELLLARDSLSLMPAGMPLKCADFHTLERMRRSSYQMRFVIALATAKRCNKFVILHNKGMLFHARRSHGLQRECGARGRLA
jgi:hypothetical protein